MNKVEYEYMKPIIRFTVPSMYTAKPLVFCVRRKTEPTRKELRAMRIEVDLMEDWANSQEDTSTRRFRQSYIKGMRDAFRKVLKGFLHYRITDVTIWRKATRLNEHGENDYRTISQDRAERYEWRKVEK